MYTLLFTLIVIPFVSCVPLARVRLPRVVVGEVVSLPPLPKFKETIFDQYLDHSNFATQPQKFKQRVFISDEFYGGSPTDPIFFYTGNESPVTDYIHNSGFMTRVLAPKYKAMLVFAEHRYFGGSLPFGNSSFEPGKVNYLTPEQALADYAHYLTEFKMNLDPRTRNAPVVAFGGSYGGMLTAWFRAKYPNIVIGGLAASAPFAFYGTGRNTFAYMDRVQKTFREAGSECDTLLGAAVLHLVDLAKSVGGRQMMTSAFPTCKPITNEDQASDIIQWVQSGWVIMAELDYPAAADYGIVLPAWPVNATCDLMVKHGAHDLLNGIAAAMQVYYNSTGKRTCVDPAVDQPDFAKSPGWGYIYCTNSIFPMSQRGMFYPHTQYNIEDDVQMCKQQWDIDIRPYFPVEHWGGFESFSAVSNVIFSNGLLDPWSAEGVVPGVDKIGPGSIAFVIPEAAHHLDLRAPNDSDPHYVVQARQLEDTTIGGWLKEYNDLQQ